MTEFEPSERIEAQDQTDESEPRQYGGLVTKAVVALAGVSLVFEQTPLNEALRTNIALDVLASTQSPTAVGLTVAAVTAGIEGVSSGLITAGLNMESSAIERFKQKIRSKNKNAVESNDSEHEEVDENRKSLFARVADQGADAGIALGIGAGLVTIKKHMVDPEPTLGKDIAASAKATAIVSGVSGTIGYLAAGGISQTEGTILETPAEYFIDYATDTRFWIGALAVGYGIAYARKGIKALRRNNTNAANIQGFLDSHQVQAPDTEV